jgi:hypothetical protein
MPWLDESGPEAELWSGRLELVPGSPVRDATEAVVRDPSDAEVPQFDARDLPEVAIGSPETWRLTDQFPLAAMDPAMRARVEAGDFYIVRLGFSIRPTKDEVEITWARFAVELAGARAEAIHPEVIEDEVDHTRRFTLSPSLKFAEVEAQAGELEFGFQYTKLEPCVWGVTEPYPSWDFEATQGRKLYGNRRMHLLAAGEPGAPTASARLHLVADVRIKRFLRRATHKRDLPALDVALW